MSEKRVYQDKMLNSEKEIVVCNWERGEGKTYSIFKKIIENKNGKYLYISPFESIALREYFEEYAQKEKDFIKIFKYSRDKLYIEYKNGNILEVLCYNASENLRGIKNIYIAFCDEFFPNKHFIDTILKPIGTKQIFIMMTNDNIEYIDSRQIKTDFTTKDFYDTQIKELMQEYTETPKNKTTTMTRENILKQIKVLQDMKKNG